MTKEFFPKVDYTYRLVRTTKITPTLVQAFTGHGGIAAYLHRFKIKESPNCECDEQSEETIWYNLFDCSRFLAERTELEIIIGERVACTEIHGLIGTGEKSPFILAYIDRILRRAAGRNGAAGPPVSRGADATRDRVLARAVAAAPARVRELTMLRRMTGRSLSLRERPEKGVHITKTRRPVERKRQQNNREIFHL